LLDPDDLRNAMRWIDSFLADTKVSVHGISWVGGSWRPLGKQCGCHRAVRLQKSLRFSLVDAQNRGGGHFSYARQIVTASSHPRHGRRTVPPTAGGGYQSRGESPDKRWCGESGSRSRLRFQILEHPASPPSPQGLIRSLPTVRGSIGQILLQRGVIDAGALSD